MTTRQYSLHESQVWHSVLNGLQMHPAQALLVFINSALGFLFPTTCNQLPTVHLVIHSLNMAVMNPTGSHTNIRLEKGLVGAVVICSVEISNGAVIICSSDWCIQVVNKSNIQYIPCL
jgi:hypothetical protein